MWYVAVVWKAEGPDPSVKSIQLKNERAKSLIIKMQQMCTTYLSKTG